MVVGSGSKRSTGRRKIEIKRIEDKEKRQVCFSKRRNGLMKKAQELAILTGAEIAVIVFSPGGRPYSFATPSLDSVIRRYLQHPSSSSTANAESPQLPWSTSPANADSPLSEVTDDQNMDALTVQHDELLLQLEAEKKRRSFLQSSLQEKIGNDGLEIDLWDCDDINVGDVHEAQLNSRVAALEEELGLAIPRLRDQQLCTSNVTAPSSSSPSSVLPSCCMDEYQYLSSSTTDVFDVIPESSSAGRSSATLQRCLPRPCESRTQRYWDESFESFLPGVCPTKMVLTRLIRQA